MLKEVKEIFERHNGHRSTLVMILETKLSSEFLQFVDKSISQKFNAKFKMTKNVNARQIGAFSVKGGTRLHRSS
jgi:F0F1-type ATP synthase delta subunit